MSKVDTPESRLADAFKDPRMLIKRISFGATIGGITGISFAVLDAMQSTSSNPMKGAAKMASAAGLNTAMATTSVFAGFFGVYHGAKHLAEETRNKDDAGNILLASGVAFTPMLATPYLRGRMPYGVLLVFMDYVNTQILHREPDT
mmetsp:Transcript_5662/g.15830  ORF Transcript_5662/g.15830 Transcript_5662/m.15830 type:complete len:146 (+) Transcript_5662:347-784(+)